MEPLRSTSLDLQFAAQLSPWWLLLILPPTLYLTWRLGHARTGGAGRVHAIALTALRLVVVGVLVVLLFRPSLVLREVLTWPGRLVVLVDDSRSMQVADPSMSDAEAMYLGRSLGMIERPAPAGEIAERAAAAEDALRHLGRLPRPIGDDPAWWDQVEIAGAALAELHEEITRGESGATAWSEDARSLLPAATAPLRNLSAATEALIAGQAPASGAIMRLAEAAYATAHGFASIQARLDGAAIAGDAALAQVASSLRSRSRSELASLMLDRAAARLGSRPAGLAVEQVNLSAIVKAGGETDLHGALRRIVGADHPQPLAAVVVVSDGRDTADSPTEGLAQRFAERGASMSAVMVGCVTEPVDLAVIGLTAPPVAVAGRPVPIRATIKAALAQAADVRVRLESKGAPLSEQTISLPVGTSMRELEMHTILQGDGRQILTVSVAPMTGEAVPTANNSREISVILRSEPLRVLVADQRPRWQSRFIATTLGRLPYTEVNLVIAAANEGGRPPRGTRQGAWPSDAATLRLYDMVVLGPWPEEFLSVEEWRDLQSFVEDSGRTLWVIGDHAPALPGGASVLPIERRGRPAGSLSDLAVTAPGARAPFTRSWSSVLSVLPPERAMVGLSSDAIAFAARADGTPVLAARRAGKGLIVQLDGDRLWQRLNPQAYDAHVSTVTALAESAATMQTTEPAAWPWLANTSSSAGVQVVLPSGASGMQLVPDGEIIAAHAAHPGSSLLLAEHENLPPGEAELRIIGADASVHVYVHDDSRELSLLAADPAALASLATATGGRSLSLAELPRLWSTLEPRERIERHERVWRLWDSVVILTVLLALLALEWAWRKYVGLV